MFEQKYIVNKKIETIKKNKPENLELKHTIIDLKENLLEASTSHLIRH